MRKALEMAKWADLQCDPGSECAAELRRLADVNADLLEALQALESAFMVHTRWNREPLQEIKQARAAIKKATE